jgi:hypothetical protein
MLLLVAAWGCASGPVNPSFNVTEGQAKAAIAEMRTDRREL